MSADFYEHIFEYAPVAIDVVDGERKIIYGNDAYYKLHGYIESNETKVM